MPSSDWDEGLADAPGNAGSSLHAGVAVKPCQHEKLNQLCRYIVGIGTDPQALRPAIETRRQPVAPQARVGDIDGATDLVAQPIMAGVTVGVQVVFAATGIENQQPLAGVTEAPAVAQRPG